MLFLEGLVQGPKHHSRQMITALTLVYCSYRLGLSPGHKELIFSIFELFQLEVDTESSKCAGYDRLCTMVDGKHRSVVMVNG